MITAVSIAMLLIALTRTGESTAGWSEQVVPAGTPTLYVIHSVNQHVAWAAGNAASGSPVIRTIDGGANWHDAVGNPPNWPPNASIWAIYALSDQVCLVGTNFGVLVRTHDGGNNWYHVWQQQPLSFVRGIHFFDQWNGWAICDPSGTTFVILETTDGGLTWAPSPTAPFFSYGNGVPDSYGWMDNQTGIFGTTNFHIKHTSNGGVDWTDRPSNVQISDVALSPTGIGLAGGRNFQLDRSTDGGWTWNPLPSPDFSIGCFDFVDGDSEVWAHSGATASITSYFVHSTNGGDVWTVTPAATDYRGYDLHFANPNHGWSVGGSTTSNAGRIFKFQGTTGIDAPSPAAQLLTLPQNHPNPFNPSTSIEFGLPEPGLVTLGVYTAGGRLVSTLKEGHLQAGYHSVRWTGHDRNGRSMPSGVYVYRLEAGGRSLSRKLVLAR
jgi:photosystem II stability/assembly factor-like uncharacterized protein